VAEEPYTVSLAVKDASGAEVRVVGTRQVSVRPQQHTRASAALLCAVAATILFGGLFVCLGIAGRGRAPERAEDVAGPGSGESGGDRTGSAC
jgi:hypothetical protein